MTAIHWLDDVNGSFTNASDWSGGKVPGPADAAILDAPGDTPYTVSSYVTEHVESIQTNADATLALVSGSFFDAAGTGAGENNGIILIASGAAFRPAGDFVNSGAIDISNRGRQAELLVTANLTLSGGGDIYLGRKEAESISGLSSKRDTAVSLYNVDNTIYGSGIIGGGKHKNNFVLRNEAMGIIDSNVKAGIDIRVSTVNSGLIEALGVGNVYFGPEYKVDNTGGTILASGGGTITVGYVYGGTLSGIDGGILMSHDTFIDDVSIIGVFEVPNKSVLNLYGVIDNQGLIAIDGAGGYTGLGIDGSVTISGGGTINLGTNIGDVIAGSNRPTQLINVDNTIEGAGLIGGKSDPSGLMLINETGGLIDADANVALTINTLSKTITNSGTIESTGSGGAIIDSATMNNGVLSASEGTLAFRRAVMGGGEAVIGGGTLAFQSSFNETVSFTGGGALELGESQQFTNWITGFSVEGATSLDLRDIGFVNADEATFSGTASSGVLTVTDGTHTARVNLEGDYLDANFVASGDGQGGTDVVAETSKNTIAPPLAFISALAGFGASAVGHIQASEAWADREPLLAGPRVAIA